jgi:hypothetical protein
MAATFHAVISARAGIQSVFGEAGRGDDSPLWKRGAGGDSCRWCIHRASRNPPSPPFSKGGNQGFAAFKASIGNANSAFTKGGSRDSGGACHAVVPAQAGIQPAVGEAGSGDDSPLWKRGAGGDSCRRCIHRASRNPPSPPFSKGGNQGFEAFKASIGNANSAFTKGGSRDSGVACHAVVPAQAGIQPAVGEADHGDDSPLWKRGAGGDSCRQCIHRASRNPPSPPFFKGGNQGFEAFKESIGNANSAFTKGESRDSGGARVSMPDAKSALSGSE